MSLRQLITAGLGIAAVAGGVAWLLGMGETTPGIATEEPAMVKPEQEPLTLRLGVISLPPALGNPYRGTGVPTIFTYRTMFEGLTFLTADGEVLPRLARTWERLDDLTWRFDLRDDVVFHNGVPFTAEAVVFAVNYLTSDEGRIESVARDLGGIAAAEPVDDYTVLIRTVFPLPLLPALTESLLIVEPGQWTKLGSEGFAQGPIGTGPFKLIKWEETKASFAAHTNGWRKPAVDALEVWAIPDASTRVQAILSERVDIVIGLSRDDILAIEAEPGGGRGYIAKSASVLGISFIFTNFPPGHPLQDKRVRHALNYAVDKEAYIQAFFGGETQPASQPTTAGVFGYNAALRPYPFDPERARALLTEAGYPDGFEFVAEITIGGGASLGPAYQQVAADLLKVGVAMTLQTIPVQQLIRSIQEGGWRGEAFGMNFSAERTSDSLRPLRLHSCINRNPWYCDEDVSAMIQEALDESDLEKRRVLTEAVMAAYHEEAPAIWMHEIVTFTGLGPRVKSYRVDHNLIAFDEIKLTP